MEGLPLTAPWESSRKKGNYQVRVWVDMGEKLIMYFEHDSWDGPLAGSKTCFRTQAKALRVYEHLKVEANEQKIMTFTKDHKKLDDYKVLMLDGLNGTIDCAICGATVNKASPEAGEYLPSVDETCVFCPKCQDTDEFLDEVRRLNVEVIIHEDSSDDDSEPDRDLTASYKATVVVDDKGYASDEFDDGVGDMPSGKGRGGKDYDFHKFHHHHGW